MIKIKTLFFLLLSLNCVAENYFVEAGKKYGIDPQLLWAIAKTESQLNPNALNQNNKNDHEKWSFLLFNIAKKEKE